MSLKAIRSLNCLRGFRLFAFAAFALFVLSAPLAHAGTVSYTDTYSFPLSPGSQALSFPQYNGAGTLTSVKLDLNALITANVTAENDSMIGGNMGVSLTGLMTGSGPSSLSATAGIFQSAGPVAVSPTDGNPGSGPDFYDFGALAGSDSATKTIVSGLAAYIGGGTVTVNVNGSGGYAVSGVSDSTIKTSNFGASGDATITYTYVPEPGTLLLGGLGALGVALFGLRKRGRRS